MRGVRDSFAMAAFPERIHWEGVTTTGQGRLASGTPPRRCRKNKFAREARLATTAKGEAMIAIAVNWWRAGCEG